MHEVVKGSISNFSLTASVCQSIRICNELSAPAIPNEHPSLIECLCILHLISEVSTARSELRGHCPTKYVDEIICSDSLTIRKTRVWSQVKQQLRGIAVHFP